VFVFVCGWVARDNLNSGKLQKIINNCLKPVKTSYLKMAVGHVTSCGCTGVWSVEKIVPTISGLVNRGR